MFCMKCGSEIEEGSSFCSECGYQMSSSQTDNNQTTPLSSYVAAPVKPTAPIPPALQAKANAVNNKSKKTSPLVWILAAMVVVLAIVLFVVLAGKDDKKSPKDGDGIVAENDVKEDNSSEEKTSEDTVETTEATTENTAETATEVTEASTESVAEETQIEIEDYTASDCETLVAELKNQQFSNSGDYDKLFEITQIYISAKIIDFEGQVLSNMSDDKKLSLVYRMLDKASYDENCIFYNQLTFMNYTECNLAQAESVFYDAYGCNGIPGSGNGVTVSGDTVSFMPATGDAWNFINNISIQENDNYYLVTAPYFYGCNGQNSEEFLGYADLLFVKNSNSRYGVTMIYAKAHNRSISISQIEVSSHLEPQMGNYYDASNLYDGNYSTAWVEGRDGVGIGETITIYLNEQTPVYGTLLFNGYLASTDLYDKNGKVTSVSVDFGDGQKKYYDLYVGEIYGSPSQLSYRDFYVGNTYIDRPIVTNKITITIEGAVAGNKYDDTCISEIKIY